MIAERSNSSTNAPAPLRRRPKLAAVWWVPAKTADLGKFGSSPSLSDPDPVSVFDSKTAETDPLGGALLIGNDIDADKRSRDMLDTVYQLVQMGEDRKAIDVAFEFINDLTRLEDYPTCRRLLELTDVQKLNSTLMVALLSITLSFKDELRPSRPDFYARVRAVILNDRGPERTGRLLDKYR